MKEINIAKTIISKRKAKGITQDDLASYIGVSKASVSKWETGQSYPDITFLPQLAAYFNISIDELMSYSPQMTTKDIKHLYHTLAERFSKEFDETYSECRAVIKKYYSCFPLLLQMGVLLINHHMLAPEKEKQTEILEEAIELCIRVKAESSDARICEQANAMHATSLLIQGKASEVVVLLDDTDYPSFKKADGGILTSAYMAMGNTQRAKEILQIEIYEQVLSIMSTAPMLITLNADNPDKADKIISRISAFAELFEIEKLHSNTLLILYLTVAYSYITRGEKEKALEYLSRYSDTCCAIVHPMTLHGDDFFDSIDSQFEKLDLGASAPRDEKVIKESMLKGVIDNPAFEPLKDTTQYKRITDKLTHNAYGR